MSGKRSGKISGWILAAGLAAFIALLGALFFALKALPARKSAEKPGAAAFEDRAAALGLIHPNVSGAPERLFIFENLGSGGAFFDYNGDDRLDLIVNNAGASRLAEDGPPRVELLPGPGPHLYEQRADGRFEEVTARAGIDFKGWGTGVAVGDLDNDGDLDLFLCAFGANQLYVNDGDGAFTNRSRAAGVDHAGMSSSAVFFDYDRDGLLDLYVAGYVHFDLDRPPNGGRPCLEHGVPISCGPAMHSPAGDRLYHNRGGGAFEEVTRQAGIAGAPPAYGLGVASGDLDRNGWPDLYVANDTMANYLWLNQGDGTFQEAALFSGAALSASGQGQAGMGVDLADANGDGWLDIHVTNYSEEPNAYYQSLGEGSFGDLSSGSGMAGPSFLYLGWGTKFFDYDQDGALDLVVANGHVHPRAAELGTGLTFEQRLLVFHGGGGHFEEVGEKLGGPIMTPRNHRGLAAGDFDRDGDVDLLLTRLDGPPLLLENRCPGPGNWIAFKLAGRQSNREGIGARIEVEAGGKRQWREMTRGGSYLSSSDAVAHFGLGASRRAGRVTITWPSGAVTRLEELEAGRRYTIEEK
ncbi:MAG: CRTAC1 family protein [Planctomycetes bacterium]|nr:CRTAC1 family protein [Planctomycetota bacterium]